MAPPMKDLPRWLLENPEFSIAPDWTDIVKQSVSNRTKSMNTSVFVLISLLLHILKINIVSLQPNLPKLLVHLMFLSNLNSSSSQGFLPEAMFDRLLTGPVVREEGVRRRGRRPKSEIAKAAAAAQAAAAQAAQASLASAASSAGKNYC